MCKTTTPQGGIYLLLAVDSNYQLQSSITPRNSSLFTRPFLAGRCTWAGEESIHVFWYNVGFLNHTHGFSSLASSRRFDFVHVDGKCVKANGYRSMLFLLQSCLLLLHTALQKCAKERGGLFYKPEDHFTTIAAHCRAFQVSSLLLLPFIFSLFLSLPSPYLFPSFPLHSLLSFLPSPFSSSSPSFFSLLFLFLPSFSYCPLSFPFPSPSFAPPFLPPSLPFLSPSLPFLPPSLPPSLLSSLPPPSLTPSLPPSLPP